ncbi:MAG: parallel beta-helix domain-containing protein, partial [Myxococcota bacterium]
MRRTSICPALFLALCAPALHAACSDSDDSVDNPDPATSPCEEVTGPCVEIAPGADVRERAQTAFIEAESGTVIVFLAGTHEFDRDLSLDVDGVTVRGEGMDQTILSFTGQTEGAQGILVTADDFVIEDLAIEDTPGDALKIEGSDGVTIRRVRVEWTAGPSEDNGAYGLYPVQCQNVLIEDSVAIAASDAGIYVGQSETIIVRRNRAEYNVAGIEIENSNDADVHDNIAENNTGGLLIFNLPGLQLKNGARTRAFNNTIINNNTENF